MGEEELKLTFLVLYVVGCGEDAYWIVSAFRFTYRVKYTKRNLKIGR